MLVIPMTNREFRCWWIGVVNIESVAQRGSPYIPTVPGSKSIRSLESQAIEIGVFSVHLAEGSPATSENNLPLVAGNLLNKPSALC
jgi:hypothetical protein